MIKKYKRDVTCSLPLPLSQTVTPSRTPSPLERDVLYGRPLNPGRAMLAAVPCVDSVGFNHPSITRRLPLFHKESTERLSILRRL